MVLTEVKFCFCALFTCSTPGGSTIWPEMGVAGPWWGMKAEGGYGRVMGARAPRGSVWFQNRIWEGWVVQAWWGRTHLCSESLPVSLWVPPRRRPELSELGASPGRMSHQL